MSPRGRKLLKFCAYLALAVVGSSLLVLLALRQSGQCLDYGAAGVRCRTDGAEEVAVAALSVLLLSIYTGVPTLLAAAGIGFAIRDAWRALRGRSARGPGRAG